VAESAVVGPLGIAVAILVVWLPLEIVVAPLAVVAESAVVGPLEIAVLLSEAVVESAEAEPLGLAVALVVVLPSEVVAESAAVGPLGIAALPELLV